LQNRQQSKIEREHDDDFELSPEEKSVWQHRYRAALAVGLTDPNACLFADARIESHELTNLIKRGCTPATALRILL